MIGQKLKEFRKSCDLTQTEVAIRANMAQSIISEIERGTRNPTVKTLMRLAKALGASLGITLQNQHSRSELLSKTPSPENPSLGLSATKPKERDWLLLNATARKRVMGKKTIQQKQSPNPNS